MARSESELDDWLAFAETLADAAGMVVRRYFRAPLTIEHKPVAGRLEQPVTQADREAEETIRQLIRKRYPDHGVLGEEHGLERPDARLRWVIDPIDGTRAFIAGLPLFGTLIALSEGDRPILGVIDQPVLRERFTGSARGAFLNRQPIRSRRCRRLSDAVYALTDPGMMRTPAQRAAYAQLRSQARVTQFGGNCYAYGMLAAGQIDLITEGDLKPWDVHALIPIIEAAGGVITGWDGGPAAAGGFVVACGDPALHAELLPLLQGAAANP